eukprot:Colp12_sorted_trinity150504_noHs@22412
MPCLVIQTNAEPTEDVEAEFVYEATDVVAKTLKKPKEYVTVVFQPRTTLAFGGSSEPAAFVQLYSIGGISREDNVRHSKAICKLLEGLQIKPERVFITFHNQAAENWGWNATTFGA